MVLRPKTEATADNNSYATITNIQFVMKEETAERPPTH